MLTLQKIHLDWFPWQQESNNNPKARLKLLRLLSRSKKKDHYYGT